MPWLGSAERKEECLSAPRTRAEPKRRRRRSRGGGRGRRDHEGMRVLVTLTGNSPSTAVNFHEERGRRRVRKPLKLMQVYQEIELLMVVQPQVVTYGTCTTAKSANNLGIRQTPGGRTKPANTAQHGWRKKHPLFFSPTYSRTRQIPACGNACAQTSTDLQSRSVGRKTDRQIDRRVDNRARWRYRHTVCRRVWNWRSSGGECREEKPQQIRGRHAEIVQNYEAEKAKERTTQTHTHTYVHSEKVKDMLEVYVHLRDERSRGVQKRFLFASRKEEEELTCLYLSSSPLSVTTHVTGKARDIQNESKKVRICIYVINVDVYRYTGLPPHRRRANRWTETPYLKKTTVHTCMCLLSYTRERERQSLRREEGVVE